MSNDDQRYQRLYAELMRLAKEGSERQAVIAQVQQDQTNLTRMVTSALNTIGSWLREIESEIKKQRVDDLQERGLRQEQLDTQNRERNEHIDERLDIMQRYLGFVAALAAVAVIVGIVGMVLLFS